MRNKLIYFVDLILIIGSVFFLMFLVGYAQPLVISPIDNFESSEGVLFSIAKSDKILIDESVNFSNPREYKIQDGLEINLDPGNYFWKAVNFAGESEIRKLSILSRVELKLKKTSEGYSVINSGNTRLDVSVYNGSELVDDFKLEIDEEIEADGDKFVGEWDEI